MSLNFGVLVPGNFPITGASFRRTSATQWTTQLGVAVEAFSVFLLSSSPEDALPPGMGLAIYLSRTEDTQDSWMYVGHIHNERPSALLRTPTSFLHANRHVNMILGCMLMPISELKNIGCESELEQQAAGRAATMSFVAEKLAQDFTNFLSSKTEMRIVRPASQREGGGGRRGDDDDDAFAVPQQLQPTQQVQVEQEFIVLPIKWVAQWESFIQSKIRKDHLLWS